MGFSFGPKLDSQYFLPLATLFQLRMMPTLWRSFFILLAIFELRGWKNKSQMRDGKLSNWLGDRFPFKPQIPLHSLPFIDCFGEVKGFAWNAFLGKIVEQQ